MSQSCIRILFGFILPLSITAHAAEFPASIPLWPQGAPDSEGKSAAESVRTSTSEKELNDESGPSRCT